MNNISKVLFIGSKELGLSILKEIYLLSPDTLLGVITIDDHDDTRTMFKEFQKFSDTNKIKLYVAKNKQHSEEIITDLQPDLCLVVCWYWLLSNKILELVPYGLIGIHNSLLPKYRGGSPLINQIINGETNVGFSVFSFSYEMDNGKIWLQEKITVEKDDYISDIMKKLEEKTIESIHQNYVSILKESIKPVEQKHHLATFCAQRFPDDGNINWNKSSWDVYNFIRAQSDPYPGAFTPYKNSVIKIWKAKIFENKYYGEPGQVARITDDGVYVICGNNTAIILQDIEYENGREKANKVIKSIKTRFLWR
jgi:methionyl-tRNA formyltransferase